MTEIFIPAKGGKLKFNMGDLAMICPHCRRPYFRVDSRSYSSPAQPPTEQLTVFCEHRDCKTERVLVAAYLSFDDEAA